MTEAAEYRWFAIQTTAGHENKVRGLIAQRIAQDPRPEGHRLIKQALVPVQEVVEIDAGIVQRQRAGLTQLLQGISATRSTAGLSVDQKKSQLARLGVSVFPTIHGTHRDAEGVSELFLGHGQPVTHIADRKSHFLLH